MGRSGFALGHDGTASGRGLLLSLDELERRNIFSRLKQRPHSCGASAASSLVLREHLPKARGVFQEQLYQEPLGFYCPAVVPMLPGTISLTLGRSSPGSVEAANVPAIDGG